MGDPKLTEIIEETIELTQESSFVLADFLFKEQLDFANDPARFATAVCSVRAGKTTACAADLINTALHRQGTTELYVTLTRTTAKRIVWPELHSINRQFELGGIPNESDLSYRFGRSIIYLAGANNAAEIEKIRGLSNVALAYIDESQLLRAFVKELVEDILTKRLYDTNGRLRMIGTPGPIPAGYFYDISQNAKWAHHAWTLHSNPWIVKKSGKTVTQLIQEDCELKGVLIDDPSIQRECFGRWVLDSNSLLLQYSEDRNHYTELPQGSFTYILGMDFGYEDADAFCVLGWHESSPNTYLIEELIEVKQTYEQMAANFDRLHKKYGFSKVIADPGGGGKKLIESLRPRYDMPMEPADKLGKIANYGLLNNALRTGRFLAKRDSRFAQDCNLLEKDRDKSTPDKTIVKGHSDIIDAALYAFRESPAFCYVPPKDKAKPGTKEYDDELAESLFQNHVQKLEREREAKDGQGRGWATDNKGVPTWLKFDE